jgi:hypothetical protein
MVLTPKVRKREEGKVRKIAVEYGCRLLSCAARQDEKTIAAKSAIAGSI